MSGLYLEILSINVRIFGGYSCIYDILLIHYNFSRGGGKIVAGGAIAPSLYPLNETLYVHRESVMLGKKRISGLFTYQFGTYVCKFCC